MKSLRTAHIRMLSLSALSIAPLLLAATAHAAPISPDKTIDVPPPNMPYKPPAPKFSPPPSDGFRWSAEARAPKWVQAWRPLTWPEGDKLRIEAEKTEVMRAGGPDRPCEPLMAWVTEQMPTINESRRTVWREHNDCSK